MRLKNRISLINIFIYLTIFGYWYNLPVIKTSAFGGYNEFRIYDITFVVLILLLIRHKNLKKNLRSLAGDSSLKYIYRFAIWASIMTIPTLIYVGILGNFVYAGMTVIFLYHLWGFILLSALVVTYYDKDSILPLIRWFMILSSIHLVLYYLQISGIIGNLWPQVYIDSYGDDALSGTLGPNRVTPGMMTLMGFILSIFIILNKFASRFLRLISWFNLILALPAFIMIGSRTTFVTLAIFAIVFVFFYRIKLAPVILILTPLFILIYSKGLDSNQKERITKNIEWNERKLLRGGDYNDLSVIEGYENLGSNRAQILERYVPYLLDNFYFIPFGSGFNNRILASTTGAASAHNIYLSLINEVGIVGLIFYLQWLGSYFVFEKRLYPLRTYYRAKGIMSSLSIAMFISLFAGEHLYVYRPCFAILGTFLFVSSIMKICQQETNDLSTNIGTP